MKRVLSAVLILAVCCFAFTGVAHGKVLCFEENYTNSILQIDFEKETGNFTGVYGASYLPAFGHYLASTSTLAWNYYDCPVVVTWVMELTSLSPVTFVGPLVNSAGYTPPGGPWTLTQVPCP